MCNEIDLYYHLDFDTDPLRSSLEIGYGIFLPGAGVQDAKGTDDPAHFVYVQGDFRF